MESVQYFVGKTGQTTPFITSFSDGPGTYVSAVGTFTSFDEEALSGFSPTIYHTKYFTHALKPYDIDLDSDKVFAELDLFFDGEGSLMIVQVRVLTDKENAKANGKEYAITYVLPESFLLED